MLVTTLLIMGVATFLVGCLPIFDQVGIRAPILLVVLCLIQGLGDEWGGAVPMATEHAAAGRRGYYSNVPQMEGRRSGSFSPVGSSLF